MGKECKQALNESLFATSCSEMGGSMKIIVVLMAVVFMAGMAIWLFLFKNCYEMIQDIRSGTRKVPVIRKAVDKYDDCCKLEIAVNNTEVFVEKIIENEKICGLREWSNMGLLYWEYFRRFFLREIQMKSISVRRSRRCAVCPCILWTVCQMWTAI